MMLRDSYLASRTMLMYKVIQLDRKCTKKLKIIPSKKILLVLCLISLSPSSFFFSSFKTAIKSVKQKTVASNQKIYVLCSFCNIYKLRIYCCREHTGCNYYVLSLSAFFQPLAFWSQRSLRRSLYICMQSTLDAYEYFQLNFWGALWIYLRQFWILSSKN